MSDFMIRLAEKPVGQGNTPASKAFFSPLLVAGWVVIACSMGAFSTGCISAASFRQRFAYEPDRMSSSIDARVSLDVLHTVTPEGRALWKSYGNFESTIINWEQAIREVIIDDMVNSGLFDSAEVGGSGSYDYLVRIRSRDCRAPDRFAIELQVCDWASKKVLRSYKREQLSTGGKAVEIRANLQAVLAQLRHDVLAGEKGAVSQSRQGAPGIPQVSSNATTGNTLSVDQSRKKETCAVLQFDAKAGISKDEASLLTERFYGELDRLGQYSIIPRSQMGRVLEEQKFSRTDNCSASECAIEAGQMLAARFMIYGTLGRVGQTFTVSVNLLDVEKGNAISTANYDYEGKIDKLLTDGMASAARMLVGMESGSVPSETETKKTWK